MATLRGALPSLLGIAAGVASSIVISFTGVFSSPAKGKAEAAVLPVVERVVDIPIASGTNGLEQATRRQADRLAAIERHLAAVPSAVAPATAAPPVEDRPLEQPDEGEFRQRTAHDELRARHEKESVDVAWARPASQGLQSELSNIGQSAGFQVNNVDCRSTSCVATLDWPSRDDAKQDLGALLDAKLGRDEDACGRDVFFDDTPLNAAGKYQARVVFSCRRPSLARAE